MIAAARRMALSAGDASALAALLERIDVACAAVDQFVSTHRGA